MRISLTGMETIILKSKQRNYHVKLWLICKIIPYTEGLVSKISITINNKLRVFFAWKNGYVFSIPLCSIMTELYSPFVTSREYFETAYQIHTRKSLSMSVFIVEYQIIAQLIRQSKQTLRGAFLHIFSLRRAPRYSFTFDPRIVLLGRRL